MNAFLRSGSIIALVLVFHVLAVVNGWYGLWWWYDIPMHFLGGYAMAVLALDAWRVGVASYSVQGKGVVGPWAGLLVQFFAVMGFVAIISIAWEWFEFGVDQLFDDMRTTYGLAQPSIADTMGDFFNDLLGGVIAFFVFRDRK